MSERGPVAPGQTSPDVLKQRLTDHAASDRLVIARGVFTGPNVQVSDEMYARVAKGKARRERHALHLDKGATVDTNTYFGRLPASYFQRWTTVTEVQLRLVLDTSTSVQLALRGSDSQGNARTIASTEVVGTGTAVLSARLNEFVDGGSLWMECTAVGGPVTITNLEWTAPSPSAIRPAAITICTFNRPADCATTLAAIADDKGLLDEIDAVYVVDQGTDAVADAPRFSELAAQLGDKLVYLRQANLGGSGGFTRGMYEISSISDHANVILMDDDILCEPEAILRLNAFANLTPTPTIVGAQMLNLKNTRYLHVGAEGSDLSKLRPGRWAANALHSSDMVKHRQNKRTDGQYNGWWSCLIPAEIVASIGLPLPIFIKWDDIEYGLRAAAKGYPTVTLPNAGVWHAEFHWKDLDDWIHYFIIRNALITASLHDHIDPAAMTKLLAYEISLAIVSMRYGLAHTIIRGIEDFLERPGVLSDGGMHAAKRIREERAKFPDTVMHPAVKTHELVNALPPTRPAGFFPKKKRMNLVLTKRAVFQWLGRTIPGPVTIPAADAHWWHVSLFDHVVVTDASQAGVRILRRDPKALKQLTRDARKVLRRFRAEAPAAQQQYRDALPQLTSRENWARLFGS
jgi:galactofuranosylgalactofuranosylrhamnosyl-N-acetylglucosaminyl-diphospho-decaprenol beta-1,5/1,6-galactofuranosyltransferase